MHRPQDVASRSSLNAVAARLRILEQREHRAAMEHDKYTGMVMATEARAHSLLDHLNQCHCHSLTSSLRRAVAAGYVDKRLSRKLRQLSVIATAVRHITFIAMEKIIEELETHAKVQADMVDIHSLAGEDIETLYQCDWECSDAEFDSEDSAPGDSPSIQTPDVVRPANQSPTADFKSLDKVGWERIHAMFPQAHGALLAAVRRREADLLAAWHCGHTTIPNGSLVKVQFGLEPLTGVILRRGYDRFQDQYRVQFDVWNGRRNGDSWIDCWRCWVHNEASDSAVG